MMDELEIKTSTSSMISLLTPPQSSKREKQVDNNDGDVIAKEALTRAQEEGVLVTRDKKTKQAIEEGVQAGVESLSASLSTVTSR